MRVLNAIRRWYRETGRGGGYVWFSVPGRRNNRGAQPDPVEYQVPDFSNRDDFSPALYANLCAFDVEDLGFHVRLRQWGRSGPDRTAQFSHLRLVYAYPDFGGPAKAMELDQDDFSDRARYTSLYELTFECRQEREFSLHQQLYAPLGRDLSFEHVTMRTFTSDRIAAPMTFLDFWRGANRKYCITHLPVGDVQLQAVLSGFDEEEAVDMMNRLVPIAGDDRLVEWHDSASRRLRAEIESLLGGQHKPASH